VDNLGSLSLDGPMEKEMKIVTCKNIPLVVASEFHCNHFPCEVVEVGDNRTCDFFNRLYGNFGPIENTS
jgi:hypothetical protein